MIVFETKDDYINYMREWLKKQDTYDKFLKHSMLYTNSNFDDFCSYIYKYYIFNHQNIFNFCCFFSFIESSLSSENYRYFLELKQKFIINLRFNSLPQKKYWDD